MNDIMPSCEHERAEHYVAGTLAPPAANAFEQHLIECEACAALVLGLEHVRRDAQTATSSAPARSRMPLGALALAASVVLALAGAVTWWSARETVRPAERAASQPLRDSATTLAALAAFEPPPYIDLATRGGSDREERFAEAMRLYNRREFPAAIEALRAVVSTEPEMEAARLFLGISLLADGRASESLDPLTSVSGAPSPYSTLAQLMIARARLALGDAVAARAALTLAAAGDDPGAAAEARALLSRLAEQHEPRP